MKVTMIAGARPNFMKVAPIIKAITEAQENGLEISYQLVHTGQHYDLNMSDSFFKDLHIPAPDVNLGCSGGSQAQQTAHIMMAFEAFLIKNPTDLVLVVGDVNSTMACTIVAKKLHTKVAHVEAGIRSFDVSMPEEINRMLTDSICDYFFTTSETANQNLKNTGIQEDNMFFVGNVMIDTLLLEKDRFVKPEIFDKVPLRNQEYFVLTMHRPANVDDSIQLKERLVEIERLSEGIPIIFPVHPRTDGLLRNMEIPKGVRLIKPLGYLEFNYLVQHAKAVITDSGGVTEETTVLGVPCLTLRNTTERPETVHIGTNVLVGNDPEKLIAAMRKLHNNTWKKGGIPPKWDGKTARRIVKHLLSFP